MAFATNVGTICEEWAQLLETRGWTFERWSQNAANIFIAIAECDLHSVNGTVMRCRDKIHFSDNLGNGWIKLMNARSIASVDEDPADVWHADTSINPSREGTWTGWVSDQDDHSVLVLSGVDEGNPRVITFFPPKGSWYALQDNSTETYPSVTYMPHYWQDYNALFDYRGNSATYDGSAFDVLRGTAQYSGHPNNIPYIIKNYHEWRAMGASGYSFDLANIRQNDVHTYFVPDGGHAGWGYPNVLKYNDIYYIVNGAGSRSMLLEVGTQRPW